MPTLDFHPETDGFAFGNSWTSEPNKRDVLPKMTIDILAGSRRPHAG